MTLRRDVPGKFATMLVRAARWALGAGVLATASLSSWACNAIVDPNEVQCNTDSDCAKLFGGSVCSPQKVCLSTACSSTSECTEKLGQEAYCRPKDHTCVPLLNKDCTSIYPEDALEEDDVIVIGFMGPIVGSGYGVPLREGAELAFRDFDRGTGIPGARGGGNRQLALLVCNHTDESAQTEAVARHLAEVVQVPAILGPATSGMTLHVFDNVTKQADVLLLSPSATSPEITARRDVPAVKEAGDDLLLWRTVPSDVVQTEVMKAILPTIQGALVDSGVLAPGEYPRVTVASKDDAAGWGLFDGVRAEDDTFATPADAIDIAVHSYYKNQASTDWEAEFEKLRIESDPPHVIIPLGTDEFVRELLPKIEERWPRNVGWRPWYLMPEGDRHSALQEFVEQNDEYDLARRVLGTAPGARRSPLYAPFRNLDEDRSVGSLAEFAYDAAYLLAYAIARSNEQFPTGPQLGAALKEMTCKGGASVRAFSGDFRDHFNVAAAEECVDFEGASGPVDFDPDTGDAVADIALWCIRTKRMVTVDQSIQTYFAVVEEEDPVTGDTKPNMVMREEEDRELDLTEDDWCNLNTEPLPGG